MQKATLTHRCLRLFLNLLLGLTAYSAQATPNITAGATPGAFDVSPSGAGTYSIPIALPPGIGGMSPSVSLNYNSQGGNGLVGMGWSVGGFSAITRCAKTIAQDGIKQGIQYTTADVYCLDGQRLVAAPSTATGVTGVYGANATEYRTERDGFSKITSYGVSGFGPLWFKVQTKAGQIMEYGNTGDSNIKLPVIAPAIPTTPYVWAINKISDTASNYLTVTYSNDNVNGQFYATRIDYTGNTGTGRLPQSHVDFVYASRTDVSTAYQAGKAFNSTVRLTNIKTYTKVASADTLVKDYQITYDYSAVTFRSLVTAVKECDGNINMPTCLPATTVGWQTTTGVPWGALSTNFTPQHAISADAMNNLGVQLLDVNGNGVADMIYFRTMNDGSTDKGAYLTTPNGWQPGISAPDYTPQHTISADGLNEQGVRFVDVDGDGRVDMIYNLYLSTGVTISGAYLNKSTGWIPSTSYIPPRAISSNVMSELGVRFVDVNGDGLVDMIYSRYMCNGVTDAGAYLNTGNGWTTVPDPKYKPLHAISADCMNNLGVQLLDVNGDGLVDMIYYRTMNDGTTDKGAYLNTPTGSSTVWVSAPDYTPPHTISADGLNEQGVRFVDVNGDGLVDMIYNLYLSTGITISGASLNTGIGWIPAPNYVPQHAISANVMRELGVRFVDVNGDGLVDMIYSRYMCNGITDAGAYLNKLGHWVSVPSYAPPHAISADCMNELGVRFVDVNGDGLEDMIYNRYITSSATDRGAYLLNVNFDRVISVTTGLGATTSITYKPLTDASVYNKGVGALYPTQDIQPPMYVVYSVSNSDSIGGQYATTYSYTGAKTDLSGRGFLGFSNMSAADPQLITYNYYNQTFPYTGLLTNQQKRLTGSPYTYVSNIINTYTTPVTTVVGTGAGTTQTPPALFVGLSTSDQITNDLNGAFIGRTKTTNTYDGLGNAYSISVDTLTSAGALMGYNKTTTNQYAPPDLVNWIVGRLVKATVQSTTP
jgi:hypothetical protein